MPGSGLRHRHFVVRSLASPGTELTFRDENPRPHVVHSRCLRVRIQQPASQGLSPRFPSGSATGTPARLTQEQFIQNLCDTWKSKSHQHRDPYCRAPPQKGQGALLSDKESGALSCHFEAALAACDFRGSSHRGAGIDKSRRSGIQWP